jgi:hypothetical protein
MILRSLDQPQGKTQTGNISQEDGAGGKRRHQNRQGNPNIRYRF